MLWSLAIEEQFYLLWPFAILLFARKRLPYFAASLIIAAPVLRGVFTPILHDHWAIYKHTPFRMDCLATGALIGLTWDQNSKKIARVGALWLAPAFAGLAALLYTARKPGLSTSDFTVKGNVLTYELSLLIVATYFFGH
jgi:peptidoglycan/LPS O-acetylase OafA/YrhL